MQRRDLLKGLVPIWASGYGYFYKNLIRTKAWIWFQLGRIPALGDTQRMVVFFNKDIISEDDLRNVLNKLPNMPNLTLVPIKVPEGETIDNLIRVFQG